MSSVKPNRRFDSRLIQKSREQPPLRRTAWGFVTIAVWTFYIYLWAPIITLALWLIGGRMTWLQLYESESSVDTFVLIALPITLLCCAALLIAWAEYNRQRFSTGERREPRIDASHTEIALGLGASPDMAALLTRSKTITLHMDEHARPVSATPHLLNW